MDFIDDFLERKKEVQRYLKVLKVLDRKLDDKILKQYDHERRIFRSGAMLIMYNAIEASARSGVEAIYDELRMQSISFSVLNENLRQRILGDFKKHMSVNKDHRMSNIAVEIVEKSFKVDKLFSGNVDAREIKKQTEKLGIELDIDYSTTRNGKDLVVIKNLRNRLAHGYVSFSDATKDRSLLEIEEIAKYSLAYMEQVLKDIEAYINNKEYLAPTQVA